MLEQETSEGSAQGVVQLAYYSFPFNLDKLPEMTRATGT